MNPGKKTILLVEDEAVIAMLEKGWLKAAGFDVIHTCRGEEAVEITDRANTAIDLILMDIDLGKNCMDGTQAASVILKNHDIPLLFLSSHTEQEIVSRTEEISSYGYVVKGAGNTVLLASINMAFKLHKAYSELKRKEEIIYNSQKMMNTVLDNFPGPVFWKDKELVYQGCNRKFAQYIGLTDPEKIAGMTDKDMPWTEKAREEYNKADRQVLETGITLAEINEPVRKADGSTVWFNTTKVPMMDAAGNISGVLGAAFDITALHNKEAELKQSGQMFHDIAKNVPGVIYQFRVKPDGSNYFSYVSEKAPELFGYDTDTSSPEWNLGAQIPPEDKSRFMASIARSIAEKSEWEYEGRLISNSEGVKWFLGKSVPMQIGDELVFNGIMFDITEKKLFEDTMRFLAESVSGLHKQEEFFRSLARYLALTLDMDYVCIDRLEEGQKAVTLAIYHDGEFEDNVEYTLKDTPCGDVVGKNICIFPKDVKGLFPNDAVLQEMKAESYLGTTLWSPEGKPIGLIAVIGRKQFEKTKSAEQILQLVSVRASEELMRQEAEELLRINEEQLQFAIKGGNLGLWDWNVKTGDVKRNRQWAEMLGYTLEEVQNTGEQWEDFLHPEDWPIAVKSIEDHLKGLTEMHRCEYRMLRKQGDYIWIYDCAMVTARDGNGNPLRMTGIHMDVDRQKKTEIQLRIIADELKTLNSAKDKFLSIIAHDLKGPFNGFIGLTEDLRNNIDEMQKDEIVEYASAINSTAKRINGLLLSLLDWSRLTTGKMEFIPSALKLSELVQTAELLFTPAAEAKSIALINQTGPGLKVYADFNMVSAIFRNLISNAIKFTNPGGRVVIRTAEKEDSIEITVADSGIGMEREIIEKVFRMDSIYTTKGTNHEEGTGLGLVLCRELIERNGGKLQIVSTPGNGSEFIFSLPKAN
ncbi:MAG: PAS domain-containing protein [Syntrophothermus sp.]